MSWKPLTKDCAPLPSVGVLFYIIDGKGKYMIMTGHCNKKNQIRVYDIFNKKFKPLPKDYNVTHWYFIMKEPPTSKTEQSENGMDIDQGKATE